jgi:fatty-acid desaturase
MQEELNKHSTIHNIVRNIKSKIHYNYVYIGLIIAAAVYFNNCQLLLLSAVVTYFLWASIEIIKHDYLEHRYIVPRNIVITYLIDFIICLTNPAVYVNRNDWINHHMSHHKYWKTDRDPISVQLNGPGLLKGLAKFTPFAKPTPKNLKKWTSLHSTFPYMFTYLREIEFILLILFVAIFGIEYFLYVIIIPAVAKSILDLQHDWYIVKFGERYYWFLFPLTLNQSWHLYHHINFRHIPTTWNEVFNGPNWLKYFNIQYYVVRLLFKLR